MHHFMLPFSLYSHFLLVLLATGHLVFLAQEVEDGYKQQQQHDTHHDGDDYPAGASLLHLGYRVAVDGWRDGEREGGQGSGQWDIEGVG